MPRLRFTDKTVKNIKKPNTGQIDYYDTSKSSEAGFGLRVSYGGKKTWFIKYVHDGKQKRKSLRTADGATATYPEVSLKEARELARDWKSSLREAGITPHEKRIKQASFKKLAQKYVDQHAKTKKRSWKQDERILINSRIYFHNWHDRKPGEITRHELTAKLADIKHANGPIIANRCLSSVRKMYSWAIKNGELDLLYHPFLRLDPPGEEVERDTVFKDTEIRELWGVFGELGMPGLVFQFCLVTGQRLMEVAHLNKKQEIENGLWTIPAARTKNKKPHIVPLSGLALGILEETSPLDETWAFPSIRRIGNPIKSFTAARPMVRERSSVSNFRPHDLRRTCMTGITKLGFSRFIADRVLNHLEPGVGRRYDRYDYLKEKTEALNAWARYLEGITGEADTVVQLSRPA